MPNYSKFNSQYDAYLAACLAAGGSMNDCAQGLGKTAEKVAKKYFSKEELRGMTLFMRENNNDGVLETSEGAMCPACHIAEWTDAESYELPVQIPD